MITGRPDLLLNLPRLEREIQAFRSEIQTSQQWYIREKYVDRAQMVPFYILLFTRQVEDRGDDLMGEPLFTTRSTALTVKRLTRLPEGMDRSYWRPITRDELISRLDRFMNMYREDYLQPPGFRGDLHNPDQQHEMFREKRFLYRIGIGQRELIGIGSKMFAGSPLLGAVRGKVMDESGAPLSGVTVELVSPAGNMTRRTWGDGLFWFSRVQPGNYRIRIKDRDCVVQIIEYEEFGNVKGWIADREGIPIVGTEVQLYAPDSEIFRGWSDASGKFTTGPLPAFPYILSIPGFLFTHQVTVVSDAIIGGILHNEQGVPLAGRTLILKKGGSEAAQTTTDSRGNFMFIELLGGRYQIELPGYRLYSKEIVGGSIKGKISDASTPMKLQLIAKEKVIIEERTTAQYNFLFDNVVPGTYRVKTGQIPGRDV
jgi:hypothetical protein